MTPPEEDGGAAASHDGGEAAEDNSDGGGGEQADGGSAIDASLSCTDSDPETCDQLEATADTSMTVTGNVNCGGSITCDWDCPGGGCSGNCQASTSCHLSCGDDTCTVDCNTSGTCCLRCGVSGACRICSGGCELACP